jgi:hypothetical protein
MALLAGAVTDDGLPNPPAKISVVWSGVSGPGTTTFTNPRISTTTVGFSLPGRYQLRLTATDGQLSSFAEITVNVNPAPPFSSPSDDRS